MVRKNVWDLLASKKLDCYEEANSLYFLVNKKNTFDYGNSLADELDYNFLYLEHRQSFVTLNAMLHYLGLDTTIYDSDLDKLDLLMETLLLLTEDLYNFIIKTNTSQINNALTISREIRDNINNILSLSNQMLLNTSKDKKLNKNIIVPKDELATTAAEISLPDDANIALSILGYSHYSNKNDLINKRLILNQLANYIEPKLNKHDPSDSNIGFALNNLQIRHNNDNQLNINDKVLNNIYDLLYREILRFITNDSHSTFTKTIKNLRQKN